MPRSSAQLSAMKKLTLKRKQSQRARKTPGKKLTKPRSSERKPKKQSPKHTMKKKQSIRSPKKGAKKEVATETPKKKSSKVDNKVASKREALSTPRKTKKAEKGDVRIGDINFKEGDLPQGWCALVLQDQSVVCGYYVAGNLQGRVEKYDQYGRMRLRGEYAANMLIRSVEVYDEYGGRVVGELQRQGAPLSGDNWLYVFPDGRTALVGQVEEGRFQRGRYAMLAGEALPAPRSLDVEQDIVTWMSASFSVKVPKHQLSEEIPEEVHQDESTEKHLVSLPLVPDLYEVTRVEVQQSLVDPQHEGLFARVHLSAGELCSWFTGVRRSHQEMASRKMDTSSPPAIPLDGETALELPAEYASTKHLRACLGHKARHSSPGNATYDTFGHPRFGVVRAIRVAQDVAPGEEIRVDYGRLDDLEDLPEWYCMMLTNILPKMPQEQDPLSGAD